MSVFPFVFVSLSSFLGGLMSLVVVPCGRILTCCCWCCPLSPTPLHANLPTSGQHNNAWWTQTHLRPLPSFNLHLQPFLPMSLFQSPQLFPALPPLLLFLFCLHLFPPHKHHAELREHPAASGKPATFQGKGFGQFTQTAASSGLIFRARRREGNVQL